MIKIIVVVAMLLAIAGYFVLQNGVPEQIPVDKIASTKISREVALEKVRKLPEVEQYLKDVPNGKVEVDNELEGEYNVHVYEVKNGHTATFNWYRVSIKSGEIRPEFEIETQQDLSRKPAGVVSGRICYPSEVIPKGKIEVKRIMDGYTISKDYPGTIDGAKPDYSFELTPGDYYIRYSVDGKIFGYSTTVCPTGNETTCADTKQRVPVMAVVKDGQELKNYDLCDYYYKESNAPKF